MADAYARRAAEDYAQAQADLLPTGPAWSREPDTALMRLVAGLSGVWARMDGRAADLRERETDPRRTVELLSEWEAVFGLPDTCVSEPLTVEARQDALVAKLVEQGGQDPGFYIRIAAAIDYTVEILEHAPVMIGVSEVGDTRRPGYPSQWYRWEFGGEDMRPCWTVLVKNARLSWFRMGSGEIGVDHHLELGVASDLECLIRRLKPAHTTVYFDYSGAVENGPLAGTP